MRKFGIRMDGCEDTIRGLVASHIRSKIGQESYTFVEIGSAGCKTLRAISDVISVECGDKITWRAIGTDLPIGSAWSLDMNEVRDSFSGMREQIIQDDSKIPTGMSLVLNDNPRSYLSHLPLEIDLVLIDGCHGQCSAKDFEAIEKIVKIGGLVIFHDYGEPEQGTDWQSHCCEFISVRNWVHRLRLNTPCEGNIIRKGWRWVGEIRGSRYYGGDGNSCAVVLRTDEPLE